MVKKNFLGFTKKEQKRFNVSLVIGYFLTFVIGLITIKIMPSILYQESLWYSCNTPFKILAFFGIGFILSSFVDLIRREWF